MITGSGGAQLAEEYIRQADGNAAAWRRRLEAHGPRVTRDVYDSCMAGVRYWEHVSRQWEAALAEYYKGFEEL